MVIAILLLSMNPGLRVEPAHSQPDTPIAVNLQIDNLVQKSPSYEDILRPQLARRDQQIVQAKLEQAAKAEAERVAAQKKAQEEARQAELARQRQIAPTPPPITSGPADVLATAQSLAAQRGWTGQQWLDLVTLGNRESGWNPNALNPSSGACGIPQALPCSKIADHSVTGQITWMLDYIQQRYSTPSNALAFHYANNWY